MRKIPEKLSELDSEQLSELIDRWVILRKHSERNRAILKRAMIDGICFEPLAEEFDLSVTQVKNIVYESQELLFKHL